MRGLTRRTTKDIRSDCFSGDEFAGTGARVSPSVTLDMTAMDDTWDGAQQLTLMDWFVEECLKLCGWCQSPAGAW